MVVTIRRAGGPEGSESGIGAFLQKRDDGLSRFVHLDPNVSPPSPAPPTLSSPRGAAEE